MLGTELNDIATRYYREGDGVHKSLAYFAEYERILAPVRNDHISLIELGVFDGASMLTWRDYLPNATIVGLDSAPEAPPAIRGQSRLHFVGGLQDEPAVLSKAVELAKIKPHLIIDDCSHIARVTKRSFNYLFPHLAPGGSYVIEDIGTSFLHGVFDDGQPFREPPMIDEDPNLTIFPSHTNGLVGFVKQLIDHNQRAVALQSYNTLPIERVTVLSNIAIVQKS